LKKFLIRTYPDPVLRKETEAIDLFDSKLMDLIEEMKVIMLESDGVGLAAPQVGVSKKLAIVYYDETLSPMYPNAHSEISGTSLST
jgi:peptide deformylase